jgi:glycosyl transferase family 87
MMTPSLPPQRATAVLDMPPLFGAIQNLLLARSSRVILLLVAALALLLSLALHTQVVLSSSGVWSDIHAYGIQADSVFHHQNVYTVTDRYPYPPVWIWIIALARWVSVTVGMKFDIAARVPAIIGDLALALLLLRFAWRRFGACWLALVPMLLFALNPLAILISAGHGQFDALVIFFLLLAVYLWGEKQNKRIIWGALALGMAIALKGYPALALPYFVFAAPRGSRLRLIAAAFAPLVVSVLIYCALFGVSPHMLSNVLGYQSTPDLGWGFLLGKAGLANATVGTILRYVAEALILLFAVFGPALIFRGRPVVALVALFSVFYALTYTMSVQYIFWILPFLCLAFPVWSLIYTLAGLFAAVSFYLPRYPAALPTSSPWRHALALFGVSRSFGVAALIGVSALLALYAMIGASSRSPALSSRLPSWLKPHLALALDGGNGSQHVAGD